MTGANMKDMTRHGEFPLATFSSLRLNSVSEVYNQFSRLLRHHDIVAFDAEEVVSELHYAPLSRMAMSSARLGTNMVVSARPVNDTCFILCPLDDPIELIIDDSSQIVTRGSFATVMPGSSFVLYAHAHASSLMLDIDLGYLESLIASELQLELPIPLHFCRNGSSDHGENGFVELLQFVRKEINRGDPQLKRPGYLSRLEELIASGLIYARPHNYSAKLAALDGQLIPRYIHRATDYIHAHAGEHLTLNAIASAAATSKRSLIRAFQKYKDCTPMLYVRNVRLQRAHDQLLRAIPEELSVTDVALECGFSNLGRFAFWYRKRFGENPGETLRRRIRAH